VARTAAWVRFHLHRTDRVLTIGVRATATTNCDAAVNYNAGCGVTFNDTSTSYGAGFNQAGGGFFVMYRASDSVKIWFFSREDEDIPDVIRNGPQCDEPVYPDATWGAPDANFPFYPQYCDYDTHFNAHEMVFDLTFCVSVLSYLRLCPFN
jgi:hypothetical protein